MTTPKFASHSGENNTKDGGHFELDAKTLLLGDFAENGIWWTGKTTSEHGRSPFGIKGSDQGRRDRAISQNTRIEWDGLKDWYQTILTADKVWRFKLKEMQTDHNVSISAHTTGESETLAISGNRHGASNKEHAQSDDMVAKPAPLRLGELEAHLSESFAHLQRTLLKVSENLLRRPGKPLRDPYDCRFLPMLLANPLLYPSRLNRSNTNLRQVSANQTHQSSSFDKAPYRRGGNSFSHSGIVKRILGLIANRSNDCHRQFTVWMSQSPDDHFRELVDLIGAFVTYRLTRQRGQKCSRSQDLTAGLVPRAAGSGTGTGTPAHLHATLSVEARPESTETSGNDVSYGEDWQLRAAARVMSLLFAVNNRMYGRAQRLRTSAFYNTLLDYSDLVGDFETWEARQGNFSFCQYPMFLSIWAKIHILEYDARRQMEIKAREAFFSSILARKAVSQYLAMRIRRECLVEDSLRGVSESVGTGQEDIKKSLRVSFIGEEGIDAGG